MFKRVDTILFIFFGLIYNVAILLEINTTFILLGMAQLLAALLFAITLLYSAIKTMMDKQPISWLRKSLAFILGICIIPFSYTIKYLVDTDGGKTLLVHAGLNADLTSVNLRLWTDGTYKFLNSGIFGGEYDRGHYHLKNDTLWVDNIDKNLCPSGIYIIQEDSIKKKKYFAPVPIDSSGIGFYILYIQKDNR